MSRPGATSRFCASESRSSQSSRTAASWRRSRIWCSPEVLRHGSTRGGAWPASRIAANSCSAYSSLPSAVSEFDQLLAQLGEDLDVERGVAQPRLRQRPGGPVGGGVFLRQAEAQELFDDGGEAHPRQSGQPGGEFGVEELVRPHAEFGQAGQVLAGRVQDPFDAAQGLVDDAQVTEGFGSISQVPAAFAADLDQEGALAVAESGGAFGVHSRGAVAGGQGGGAAFQAGPAFR